MARIICNYRLDLAKIQPNLLHEQEADGRKVRAELASGRIRAYFELKVVDQALATGSILPAEPKTMPESELFVDLLRTLGSGETSCVEPGVPVTGTIFQLIEFRSSADRHMAKNFARYFVEGQTGIPLDGRAHSYRVRPPLK